MFEVRDHEDPEECQWFVSPDGSDKADGRQPMMSVDGHQGPFATFKCCRRAVDASADRSHRRHVIYVAAPLNEWEPYIACDPQSSPQRSKPEARPGGHSSSNLSLSPQRSEQAEREPFPAEAGRKLVPEDDQQDRSRRLVKDWKKDFSQQHRKGIDLRQKERSGVAAVPFPPRCVLSVPPFALA